MKLRAPLTVKLEALNDWRYYAGLGAWQVGLVHVEVGWPLMLVFKVLGLGFRLEAHFGDRWV